MIMLSPIAERLKREYDKIIFVSSRSVMHIAKRIPYFDIVINSKEFRHYNRHDLFRKVIYPDYERWTWHKKEAKKSLVEYLFESIDQKADKNHIRPAYRLKQKEEGYAVDFKKQLGD